MLDVSAVTGHSAVLAAFILLYELCYFLCIDNRCLVIATPHTILDQSFFELCTCFLKGLQMCMWIGYNFRTFFLNQSFKIARFGGRVGGGGAVWGRGHRALGVVRGLPFV